MSSGLQKCRCCQQEGQLRNCSKCKLVDYCSKECQTEHWQEGHKVLCAKVPKAVAKAEEKMQTFSLGDYTTHNIGTFMVTEAQARRGEIVEESEAQQMCYDAMEMEQGSTEKLYQILMALKCFPLSTETWGMLGNFYQYEVTTDDTKKKKYSSEALKMYDNAITCARMLNPTWKEDRSTELSWGEIENRPYLRSLAGGAIALKGMGKRKEAIFQAKKLMRLNPNDNQGIRQLLCTWFLEAGDTEGCTNLLRKYETRGDTSLAYTDVLLQFLRWGKDDATEKEVRHALYGALKSNPFVPDLLGVVDDVEKDDDEDPCYSPGSLKEAKNYLVGSKKLWKKFPEVIERLSSLKYDGAKVPTEDDLIELLKSGTHFQITCAHTDPDGNNMMESTIAGTQKKTSCMGWGREDFHWPRQLNRPHEASSDIFLHNNDFDELGWRKTKYTEVIEVPYWKIFLEFYGEDTENDDSSRELWNREPVEQARQALPSSSVCKKCDSPARFCALDNDYTSFYCSEACMNDFLQEIEPIYFDLQSETLKINASEGCSILTVSLDDAFNVASEHMPNLNSVDIFINQGYVLKSGYSDDDKKLLLSANALRQFLEKMKTKLVSFSFRLDECCWEGIKEMTDRCRALVTLGTMPNLKKLTLCNFGFDDVNTLVLCLGNSLRALNLDHVMMGRGLEWTASEMDTLAGKLSELTSLVSLSLADSACTDRHLRMILPNLQSLKCLNVSGCFGRMGVIPNNLTDVGLKVIVDYCPNLLSLSVDYQRKVTTNGILYLVRRCSDLVELEMVEVAIPPQHFVDVMSSSNKLMLLMCGNFGWRPSPHDTMAITSAVKAKQGKIVFCTGSGGPLSLSLSPEHKRNQDDTMAMIERAHEQSWGPSVCNKWEGVLD